MENNKFMYEPTIDARTLIMQAVNDDNLVKAYLTLNYGVTSIRIRMTPILLKQIMIEDKMV
jgi:hypothetical protein